MIGRKKLYRWLLFLSLTVCAKVSIDTRKIDTPRGWAIDKSSSFDQGKTLRVDSFDSEQGITTQILMKPSDIVENIKGNNEKLKRLIEINVALRNALKEREDRTSFIRNYIKQLEVRVHTKLSPLRAYIPSDNSSWPRIEVDLGDEVEGFPKAQVIDGGIVVFRRVYKPDLNEKDKDKQFIYTINSIQKLTVRLTGEDQGYLPIFAEFKDDRGHKICRERHSVFRWWSCKEYYDLKDSYNEEANKVFIDKVEILVKIDDSNKEYKVFSDNSKIELRSFLHEHTFTGLKQNPHWILHAYSSKEDGWQGDHDGSEFAKKVWERIENNDKIASDIFWEVFSCTNQGLLPIKLTPQIPSPEPNDGEKWAKKNAPFTPNKDGDECEPITSESIASTAPSVHDSCLEHIKAIPDDLANRSKEELEEIRVAFQNIVNKGEQSNQTLKEELDDLIKTGCLYDEPLTDGVDVDIEGQLLISAAGRYMTSNAFKKMYPVEFGKLPTEPQMPLYINLGLDKRSYLLVKSFYAGGDGLVQKNKINIDPIYTQNFTMRDITFVHFSLGGNPQDRIQPATVKKEYQASTSFFKKLLSWTFAPTVLVPAYIIATSPTQQSIEVKTFNIEYVINIQKITLYKDDKPFYEYEMAAKLPDKDTGVISSLFTLNTVTDSWTDYNIKENLAWKTRRDDSCSD